MKKIAKNDLVFCPLGGCNEIGMNVNLYHYKGKWIMIDLGAGFADDYYPGVSMLAPDLSFIEKIRDNFLGVVLTHAHEDHLGSVGYLWQELRCPIYTTKFTGGVVKHKLAQAGVLDDAEIITLETGKDFKVGPFEIEMVQLTHSVPEMNAMVLKTEYGSVLHTGDWKFDPNPVILPTSDFDKLKQLGNEGVLALVSDSTNIMREKFSGSEGDLLPELKKLMSNKKGMIVVTTFASNVARLDTIARAAKSVGRKVLLTGWSLWRIEAIARESGFLSDIDAFITDKELKYNKHDDIVVIATGCQAESNAGMHKITYGKHPTIHLRPGDHVIFSSKIIPGNEKRIYQLMNRLVLDEVNIYTEKDHFVHVSGHPSREEMHKMYSLARPKISIPVHGEPIHLHEHSKFAKEQESVEEVFEVDNGSMVQLAPGKPKTIDRVQSGYYAVDGAMLQARDGNVMRERRRLQKDGVVFVTVTIRKKGGKLTGQPEVSTPGLADHRDESAFISFMQDELYQILEQLRNPSDFDIEKTTRKSMKRMIKNELDKYPLIYTHIVRV